MDLMIKIGYNEVLNLVKQLPASKIIQLQVAINGDFISRKAQHDISSFQEFLLSAPIMSAKEHEEFYENRKLFDKWRMKN
jgi:hypothetical protein